MPYTRTGIPLRSTPAGDGPVTNSCYVHALQVGRKFLTYLNYIFIDFDNRRIATIGKLSVSRPSANLG